MSRHACCTLHVHMLRAGVWSMHIVEVALKVRAIEDGFGVCRSHRARPWEQHICLFIHCSPEFLRETQTAILS